MKLQTKTAQRLKELKDKLKEKRFITTSLSKQESNNVIKYSDFEGEIDKLVGGK